MVDIPQGVTLSMDGHTLTAKGPKGEVSKELPKLASVKVDGGKVEISADSKALRGTIESVVTNMVKGVSEGYNRQLKVLYAHFPVSIEVKGKDLLVKNFLGEKQARKTRIVGNTKVEVKGQNVTVSGPDKEALGQTIANLRGSMKIKKKDARIFQDGIYEVEG